MAPIQPFVIATSVGLAEPRRLIDDQRREHLQSMRDLDAAAAGAKSPAAQLMVEGTAQPGVAEPVLGRLLRMRTVGGAGDDVVVTLAGLDALPSVNMPVRHGLTAGG